MIKKYQLISFLKYLFVSRHAKGYGIHSPFVFDLVRYLIYDKSKYYKTDTIDSVRKQYLKRNQVIEVTDLGAGSEKGLRRVRKISEICKHVSISSKYGTLLFKLVSYFKPNQILELGTSIGISTLYLSLPDKRTVVHTIEGSENLAQVAIQTFDDLGLENVHVHTGEFSEKLPEVLVGINSLDFVFFDGNHKKNATLKYFEQCLEKTNNETIFVFDDIHWSQEMSEAWRLICENQKVTVSLDLYRMGIVFFRKECQKQHFVVRF